MNVTKPKFFLKQICPVCEQGSSLLFLTCPSCSTVILVCIEEGTLFANPKALIQQAAWSCDSWVSTFTKCPTCMKENEFVCSTGEEIQKTGFTPDEYE